MPSRALLAAFLLVSPLAASVAAAVPVWQATGPEGASVTCLATDPANAGVVYLCARRGGIFRSDSGGTSWRPVNQGLTELEVFSIAVSPAAGGPILAGTATGLFRSVDGGDHWTPVAGPPPGAPINAIVFDPAAPLTAYAASTSDWLGRSGDGGATWQALSSPAVAQGPSALALQPGNSSIVYVGTADGGVFRSDNSGTTWAERNDGLFNLHISALAIDPTSPATVYAGTVNGGAFLSTDGGANWTLFTSGLGSPRVDTLAVDPTGTAYLGNLSGLYLRLPGSLTWLPVPVSPGFVNAIAVGPGSPGRLFVGFGNPPIAFGGLLWSDDRVAFQRTETGLDALSISSVAVDPAAPSRVIAVAMGGWESLDSGASWEFFPLPATFATVLVFDAANPGVVYEGASNGVWKSSNGGADWAPAATGLPDAPVRAILPLSNPARVFAGTVEGLFRSDDAGAQWVPATDDLTSVSSLAADAFSATLWAGTLDGVFRSTDGGANWTRSGTAIGGNVRAVLASSVTAQRVLAGAESALYVSQDGGSVWAPAAGVPGPVFALLEDPATGVLYAGTDSGVFASHDGGAAWSEPAPGLIYPRIRSLALAGDGTLLAGTFGASVLRLVAPVEPEERGAVVRPAARDGATRVITRP